MPKALQLPDFSRISLHERKKERLSLSLFSFLHSAKYPQKHLSPRGLYRLLRALPLSDGDTWARVFHQGRGHYRTEGQRVISPAVPSPQPPNIRALLIDTIAT